MIKNRRPLLLILKIAQTIKIMLKGNAGSLNKLMRLHFLSYIRGTTNGYNYIHCYMIFVIYIAYSHVGLLYNTVCMVVVVVVCFS